MADPEPDILKLIKCFLQFRSQECIFIFFYIENYDIKWLLNMVMTRNYQFNHDQPVNTLTHIHAKFKVSPVTGVGCMGREVTQWHTLFGASGELEEFENCCSFWQQMQETVGEADDEEEDSDDSEDEAMKDEFKFHLKAEGEMAVAGSGGSLILGGANLGAPATLSVVEGTNEITGEPTRVEFDPSQPLTTEIMGGKDDKWVPLVCENSPSKFELHLHGQKIAWQFFTQTIAGSRVLYELQVLMSSRKKFMHLNLKPSYVQIVQKPKKWPDKEKWWGTNRPTDVVTCWLAQHATETVMTAKKFYNDIKSNINRNKTRSVFKM